MKSYRVQVADDGGSWWEDMAANDEAGCQTIVDGFNASLRKHEKPRRILNVMAGTAPIPHQWEKSNLVTIMKGGAHDTYKCETCGITAKRYGLSSVIERDKKFEAAKYEGCKQ